MLLPKQVCYIEGCCTLTTNSPATPVNELYKILLLSGNPFGDVASSHLIL